MPDQKNIAKNLENQAVGFKPWTYRASALGLLGALCLMFAFAPPPPPPVVARPVGGASFLLITGTVAYRERIALAPNAVLRVSLEDVSRQDVAAKVLAEVNTLTDGKQVPLAFAIPYRTAEIAANHRYQVRAQIIVNGQRRYLSTTAYPVLTQGAPARVTILVQAIATTPPVSPSPSAKLEETYWKLTYLDGQTSLVPSPRQEPKMTLHKMGRKMTGSSGCNALFASYTLSGNMLKFTGIGGTMMACPEPLMRQEQTFTGALKATTTYRITGEVLDLLAGTKILARFHTVYLR